MLFIPYIQRVFQTFIICHVYLKGAHNYLKPYLHGKIVGVGGKPEGYSLLTSEKPSNLANRPKLITIYLTGLGFYLFSAVINHDYGKKFIGEPCVDRYGVTNFHIVYLVR